MRAKRLYLRPSYLIGLDWISIGNKIGNLEWPWTLNGVMAIILPYFTEFGSFRGPLINIK